MSRFLKWIIFLSIISGILFLLLCLSMVNLASEVMGNDFNSYKSESRAHFALLKFTGPIFESDTYVEQIEAVKKNSSCKGVLVRVNSPGGSVSASQEVFHALRELNSESLPVIISMGNVAASGAYYISLGGDKIFASQGTITGSIGVIAQFPEAHELFSKLGISMETVKTGKFKDAGSMFRPATSEEKTYLKEVLNDTYDQFLWDILNNRDITSEELEAVADGRILTGRQALKAGLIDTIGGFLPAKEYLKTKVNFSGEPLFINPAPRGPWLSGLMSKTGVINNFIPRNMELSFKAGLFYLWTWGSSEPRM